MGNQPSTNCDGSAGWSRRGLLGTVTVASVAGLAGCGRVTQYEFRATPVVLERPASGVPTYETTRREPVVMERSRTIGGVEVTVTMRGHVAAYREPGDSDQASGVPAFLGVISTPKSVVAGREFNPLARLSIPNLLTSTAGVRFLRAVGVDRLGHARSRVRWGRGPLFLESRAVRFLGRETALESYAGVLGGEPPTVAFVHLARVEDDTVVIVAAVHGHDVEDPDRAFVGDDEAYVSTAEFSSTVTTVRDDVTFRYSARSNREQ